MWRAPHSPVEFIILILLLILILIPHCEVSRARLLGSRCGASRESIKIMIKIKGFCDGHECPSYGRSHNVKLEIGSESRLGSGACG